MTFVGCSVPERFVNPLFEVFDGGDFVLSSYRDIEEPLAVVRVYLGDGASDEDASAAGEALRKALEVVGATASVERGEIADADWKFAYRRHFKTEKVGRHLVTVPIWEVEEFRTSSDPSLRERIPLVMDPGMAFGTGKHETTRACLEYIDETVSDGGVGSFLDMGCGSGILAIAAAKLGCGKVSGFDVDQTAVDAARENAEVNGVEIDFFKFALGRRKTGDAAVAHGKHALVAANILGPLLVRFADEIVSYVGERLIISGILTEIYPEVLAAYEARGLKEISRKTIGEWTTGLLYVV